MNQARRSIVHLPGQGKFLDLGPFGVTVKAESADTAGRFTLLEADEPAGFGPPIHVHDDADEAFYVLAGEYLIFIEDDEFRCPAGSFIYIPQGVRHGFRVGSTQSRKLNIYVPGAMIGYFVDLAAANADGTELTAADVSDIAARHSMQVLGPVPEGYL